MGREIVIDERLGDNVSLTGESDRVFILRWAGGACRFPCKSDSLARAVKEDADNGGAPVTGLLCIEYLLLEEFGTEKFGVPGD